MVNLRRLDKSCLNRDAGYGFLSFVAIAGGYHRHCGAGNIVAMRAATCGKRAQGDRLRSFKSCSGAMSLSCERRPA